MNNLSASPQALQANEFTWAFIRAILDRQQTNIVL